MTMITGYLLKKRGFLQADILLTSPNKWMAPFQIPSVLANADSPGLKAHTVVGLCQKIVVVNEHFAVAFAGDVPDIQAAVRLIDKLVAQNPELTGKRFVEACLADEQLKKGHFDAIAMSIEDDQIQITSYGADFEDCNEHLELYVGGSGSKHALKNYKDYPSHAFDPSEEDIVVHGTCMALNQFAHHLNFEFKHGFQSETISELFGGGYEVVTYHDGQFHKISDVVYAFADAELDSNNILQIDIPKYMLKSAYKGDDLVIRSVEIDFEEDEDDHLPRNDRTFFIAPVVRYQDTYVKDNCEDLRFSGRFLCFLINIEFDGKILTIPFVRKYEHDLSFMCRAFIAVVHEHFVQFIYMDKFREELTSHVLQFMKQLNALKSLE
ncbi:hypothetical protein [Pseudomonas fluorescens]|uniref:Uncharacterized protein n=1 Tax=Pseudomonas fluorescens TaxID=294 RepID=A0A5E7D1Z7_PSEFL|nr:hypothetical protein [Pseudomonas fluorescens]VVO01612.1 hypothetical protein PS710_02715 [Pseudomonas fluorescens]